MWRANLWATLKRYGVRDKLLGSIKLLQREQGLCKGGGGFVERICGRTGSKTGMPLIPMAV